MTHFQTKTKTISKKGEIADFVFTFQTKSLLTVRPP